MTLQVAAASEEQFKKLDTLNKLIQLKGLNVLKEMLSE